MNDVILFVLIVIILYLIYLHKQIKQLKRYYKDIKLDNDIMKAKLLQQKRQSVNSKGN